MYFNYQVHLLYSKNSDRGLVFTGKSGGVIFFVATKVWRFAVVEWLSSLQRRVWFSSSPNGWQGFFFVSGVDILSPVKNWSTHWTRIDFHGTFYVRCIAFAEYFLHRTFTSHVNNRVRVKLILIFQSRDEKFVFLICIITLPFSLKISILSPESANLLAITPNEVGAFLQKNTLHVLAAD